VAPSHALAFREGAAKRWAGVYAGRLLSLEIDQIWGADAVQNDGRQHCWRRFREPPAGPSGSENLCMRAISPCSRTGRSHGHPLVVMVGGSCGEG
jgi:hypothetical protein